MSKVQNLKTAFVIASSARKFLQIPSYLTVTRRFWKQQTRSASGFIRFERLEDEANSNPSNASKQAVFLAALNDSNQYEEVLNRVKSRKYAVNSRVDEEYKRALIGLASSALHPSHTTQSSYAPPSHAVNPGYYYQAPPQQPIHYQAQPTYSSPSSSSEKDIPPIGHKENPLWIASPHLATKPNYWRTVAAWAVVAGIVWYLIFKPVPLSAPGDSPLRGNNNNFISRIIGSYNYEPIQNTSKTFKDVRGVDECMDELVELVEFLKNPQKFTKLGAKLPRGVLLVGRPGVGKTLLAKAVAGEAGVPFFYVSGSEFDEVFVGVGAGRIKGLFESARQKKPCIIFIDEIDALGAKRRERDMGGSSKQTINQLLAEMDGFKTSDGIIIIGATNFPDSLDPALLRPGRFDKTIEVPLPDVKGRKDILEYYAQNKPLAKEVDLYKLALRTIGFSGAHLENLINEAAIRASIKNHKTISYEDVEHAYDRVVLGVEHKSLAQSEEDKQRTAIHESGHAIISLLTAGEMDLHKVTITPRGRSLGVTHSLPSAKQHVTKKELHSIIEKALGGIVAEEIVFGGDNVATGATSDLATATNIAREMVVKYGMSKLGLLDYSRDYDEDRFGGSHVSDETKREIDVEIRKIVATSYDKVRNLLQQHEKELRLLASELVKQEVLSGEQVKALLNLPKKQ